MNDLLSRALITGAGGMAGSYIDFGALLDRNALDITNLDEAICIVEKHRPRVIIHLAAETDVARCERDPAHAYQVNAVGVYNMCIAARAIGAKLVYVSTNAVFAGDKIGGYVETDAANPQNHYGHSKYAGELMVRAMLENYIIARTCWVFGGGPSKDKKFVSAIIRQLVRGEIKAVNEGCGSPTFAKDFIHSLKTLIEHDESGVFHLANEGVCTRYDMAMVIAGIRAPGVKVLPVPANHFNAGAKALNESLISNRLLPLRPWNEALKEYLETEWI